MRIPGTAVVFCFFLMCSTGCNSSATVTGNVTLDNAPLPTGEVMFYPKGDGPIAVGSIVNAKYQLSTGLEDSVEPGEYRVTVVSSELSTGEIVTGPMGERVEAAPKRLTPEIYSDPKTTPLTATVKSGVNAIDFNLVTPPPAAE